MSIIYFSFLPFPPLHPCYNLPQHFFCRQPTNQGTPPNKLSFWSLHIRTYLSKGRTQSPTAHPGERKTSTPVAHKKPCQNIHVSLHKHYLKSNPVFIQHPPSLFVHVCLYNFLSLFFSSPSSSSSFPALPFISKRKYSQETAAASPLPAVTAGISKGQKLSKLASSKQQQQQGTEVGLGCRVWFISYSNRSEASGVHNIDH